MTNDPPPLSHVAPDGSARMVDVSGKPVTARTAKATGTIRMNSAAFAAIRSHAIAKGDVLSVARVAGIMAAKRTAELVPLCHPLALDAVQLDFQEAPELPGFRASALVRTSGRTGVEMEAIVAVSVGLVTVYDMAKSADPGMVIGDISLVEKSGGTRQTDVHG
jgi:cyclic pyranopterin monophosphate synthase